VARADASKAGSAESTTTWVWLSLWLRAIRIFFLIVPVYFTGAAGCVTVGPSGVVLFCGAA
jgi:hypothetical protein